MKKKLFIVVNQDKFFLSHRLPIGNAAKDAGYDVTIVSEDTGVSNKIRENGLKTIALPIDKAGTNIISELKTFFFLYKLFKREKVDIVHLVGLKIILWGSLASKIARVKSVVSAVCGLGVLFDEKHADSLFSRSILKVLRMTHRTKNTKVIFQNYDDEGTMVLIDAAKKLECEYRGKIQFLLCGGLDTNPNGIPQEILERECDGKYIHWLGYRNDVLELLKQSHIMAFPSWYREGLPKSIIEAEAIGRPIVTTDSVGCRDTVIDGENGFLVPIKDPDSLAKALKKLIDDKELRILMGKKSRELAVKRYDINDVIKVHLDIYKSFE